MPISFESFFRPIKEAVELEIKNISGEGGAPDQRWIELRDKPPRGLAGFY